MINTPMVAQAPTQIVIEMKNMIETHCQRIAQNKRDLKNIKEMFDNALENSNEYNDAKLEEDKYKKERKSIKLKIESENAELINKMHDIKKETKELKSALSDYLNEYVRQTGNDQIELKGESVQIKRVASIQLKLF